ncbi:MauE/DoxX family redox-associated membrane protein [Aequorivita sinensis]|uniref:MauE/DoxX family redox-associated membrane protein n=1 Tax=Aequorivita sinensis TaxID=1382458 RepID=UPI0011227B18|nr:MauE/DoxX family redox-associated membrane protein [Aequorivita sinensis]
MTFVKSILKFLKKHFVSGVSYLFVLLFVYAAVSKILDFETFTVQLAQSPLLSAYASVIAWAVPGLEILIAVLLTIPKYRTLAFNAAFTLMMMFTAYIYIILNFSDFIPCSCGGVLEKLSWTQHLIFNIFFIILAGVAVFFTAQRNNKKTLLMLTTLAIFGVGTVTILFAFSEKKMHRNNAFQRRYIPHPIEKIHSFDLKYSSYYFAGIGNGKVYLGNSTAPLLLTLIDSNFKDTTTTMIQLDQMDLPYRAVKLHVLPPEFYVTDGTVPIILQGKISDWKATTEMQDDYYFNHIIPINSKTLALQSTSSANRENILGVITLDDSIKGIFSNQLLEKQIDGRFDTDGRLIYNANLDKLIFTYYYRNEYMVINPDLKLEHRGRTIDTISVAQLNIAENSAKGQRKLGGNTVLVNRNTATTKELLLVDSPRLGKLEPENMIDQANIIDVYRLTDQSYQFSFYLYKHENNKAREILISNGMLYALQGNYLVAYKIVDRHFE